MVTPHVVRELAIPDGGTALCLQGEELSEFYNTVRDWLRENISPDDYLIRFLTAAIMKNIGIPQKQTIAVQLRRPEDVVLFRLRFAVLDRIEVHMPMSVFP